MSALKIYVILLISALYIQNLACQGMAGEDKIICVGGTTTIGTDLDGCKGCCKWMPATALDDPSNPMPTVAGLTTTTQYTRVISNSDGTTVTDDVIVYVCSLDLDIYKPLFLNEASDPNEKLVNEALEETIGAQTFVNLDSDDNDFNFDINDNLVDGGDDEFIKLEIKQTLIGASTFPAASLSYASIKNWSGSDISSIKIWKSKDKASGEYTMGEPLLFPSTNMGSSIFLWVEGVSAHTSQRATQLFAEMESKEDNGILCSSSKVSITVLGVATTQWLGLENGYTGTGLNNINTLDSYVMVEGGVSFPPHIRVFPESKFDLGTSLPSTDIKNVVEFKVTLSTTPVEPLPVYLRLIDADDPTSSDKIDYNDYISDGTSGYILYPGETGRNYNEHEDNRGSAGNKKYGKMMALTNLDPDFTVTDEILGIYSYVNFNQIFTLKVQVSPYPGDNYQACLFGDIDFIRKARNYDKHDKQNIVFDDNDPSMVVANCPAIDNSLVSPTLTVWRTLHVEYDKMQNPTWDENLYLDGYFYDFESSSIIGGGGGDLLSKVQFITTVRPNSLTDTDYDDPGKPLKDNSTGNGRFNNGTIRIGNPLQTLCSAPDPCIASNGDDFVHFPDPKDLTFGGTLSCTVKKMPFPDLVLTIKEVERLTGPDFKVIVQTTSPVSLADYNGGSISVSGGPTCTSCIETILGNNSSLKILNTNGKSNFVVPLQIFDDDDIPLSGPSSLISDISFSDSEAAFAEAYIDVKKDGGGDSGNNQTIDFDRNIDAPVEDVDVDVYTQHKITYYFEEYAHSKSYEKPSYWVVYVLSAWQYTTMLDGDPKNEDAYLGSTAKYPVKDCILTRGGLISVIFHEAIREGSDSPSLTLAHELGHQCCLTHGNDDSNGGVCAICHTSSACPDDIGVMKPYTPLLTNKFAPYQKHLLRSRFRSPG